MALTVKVTAEQERRLTEIADQLGVTRAEAAYRALRNGMEEYINIEGLGGRALLRLAEAFGDPELAEEAKRIRQHVQERRRSRQPGLPGLGGSNT